MRLHIGAFIYDGGIFLKVNLVTSSLPLFVFHRLIRLSQDNDTMVFAMSEPTSSEPRLEPSTAGSSTTKAVEKPPFVPTVIPEDGENHRPAKENELRTNNTSDHEILEETPEYKAEVDSKTRWLRSSWADDLMKREKKEGRIDVRSQQANYTSLGPDAGKDQ